MAASDNSSSQREIDREFSREDSGIQSIGPAHSIPIPVETYEGEVQIPESITFDISNLSPSSKYDFFAIREATRKKGQKIEVRKLPDGSGLFGTIGIKKDDNASLQSYEDRLRHFMIEELLSLVKLKTKLNTMSFQRVYLTEKVLKFDDNSKDEIGKGSYGKVYKLPVTHGTGFGEHIVLKEIEDIEQFEPNEILALIKLKSIPQRCTPVLLGFQFDSANDKVQIIMEYFEDAVTLKTCHESWIKVYHSLRTESVDCFCSFLINRMATLLQSIHERGLIHGDIHAENIMLQPKGDANGIFDIYFIDFGNTDRIDPAQGEIWSGQNDVQSIIHIYLIFKYKLNIDQTSQDINGIAKYIPSAFSPEDVKMVNSKHTIQEVVDYFNFTYTESVINSLIECRNVLFDGFDGNNSKESQQMQTKPTLPSVI